MKKLVLVMGSLEWVDILEAKEIRKRDVRYIGTDYVENVDIYEDCDTGEFLGYEFMEI